MAQLPELLPDSAQVEVLATFTSDEAGVTLHASDIGALAREILRLQRQVELFFFLARAAAWAFVLTAIALIVVVVRIA